MNAAEIAERLADIRRGPFYLIHLEPGERWDLAGDEFRRLMPQHGEWLRDLEESGRRFLAGPIDLLNWKGRGLAIVRAATMEAALAIAESEPFHRDGMRANTVEPWDAIEGSINLRVDLQSGKGTLS